MQTSQLTQAQQFIQTAQKEGSVNLFSLTDLFTQEEMIKLAHEWEALDEAKHIDYTTSDFWIHGDGYVESCANAEHLAHFIKEYGSK
jgi:hypothetical protein